MKLINRLILSLLIIVNLIIFALDKLQIMAIAPEINYITIGMLLFFLIIVYIDYMEN
ncbi:hypothetical protein ACQW5G_03490 [Fructilactobacillus sp. Tb1]|uniref:hypothetical protein n=1 Tax=Fructilactobacillus sp. Tb1 TaxID=3422304 RepID=UPI003D2DEA8E